MKKKKYLKNQLKKGKGIKFPFFSSIISKKNYIQSQLACKSDYYNIDFDYLLEEFDFTIYIAKKGIENIKFYEKDDYENDNDNEKNKFNIVIMEDSNVGKTSFIEKISFLGKGKLILSNKKNYFL